jgi:hypothetical protein
MEDLKPVRRKELLYNLIGMNNSDKNSTKKWGFEN